MSSPRPPPGPPAEPPPRTTWIEIQVVSEGGFPVADALYRIALPDGEIREGRLDASGQAYLLGIDPGDCVVTFPGFEQEALERL